MAKADTTRRPVYRRVFFYRIERPELVLGALPNEIARIANLPFTAEGRYLVDNDGDRYALWADTLEYPIRLRFGKTRLSQLPMKELSGHLAILDIESDAGLAELCHVIIYADGYVAAEFNFDGPRIKRLGEYLYSKRHILTDRPTFLPLFQKDVLKLVQDMTYIKVLELRGKPAASELLRRADENLGEAFATMTELGADQSIALKLQAESKPESKLRNLSLRLAELVTSRAGDVRHSMHTLKVRGVTHDGKIDFVDLLEDHLIATIAVEKQESKSKALSSESAFRAIDSAYERLKDELASAAIGRIFFT